MEEKNETAGDHLSVTDYVLEHLTEQEKKAITEKKIDAVLDAETEYYEQKGYFNEDVEEGDEVEIDETEMVHFILGKTDNLNETEVLSILDLELEYGQSIGMYEP